jgi:hypothetical protein
MQVAHVFSSLSLSYEWTSMGKGNGGGVGKHAPWCESAGIAGE